MRTHSLRPVTTVPLMILIALAAQANGEATDGTAPGISSVAAWFMVSTVASAMIWFIWRNARKEPE